MARTAAAYQEVLNAGAPEATQKERLDAYQRACYDLASTTRGVEDIKTLQAEDPANAAAWNHILAVGERIRDRNKFLHRAAAATTDPSAHPLKGLISEGALAQVNQATAAVRADIDGHVHLRGQRIKRVKPRYRTQEEKDASVAYWRDLVETHAHWYRIRSRQDQAGDSFVTTVAHLERIAARPDTASRSLGDVLLRLPEELAAEPDIALGPEAQRMHDEREPIRQSRREYTLATVIYAARLDQALRQPVRP